MADLEKGGAGIRFKPVASSRVVIFDLDGCLAKAHSRFENYSEKNFHKNQEMLAGLESHLDLIRLVQMIENLPGVQVIILTGRPKEFRRVTEYWLRVNGVTYSQLIMRPDLTGHDWQFKESVLDQIGWDNVWFTVEDRNSCVQMWRRRGILCLQPFEGNF